MLWVANDLTENGGDVAERSSPADTTTLVKVKKMTSIQRHQEIELFGKVEPWVQLEVPAKGSGVIEEIYSDIGDNVDVGDVLAEIEKGVILSELSKSKFQVLQREYETEATRGLVKDNLQTKLTLAQNLTELSQAKAEMKLAEQNLANLKIRSPIRGSVEARNYEIGEQINVGETAFEIVDLSKLRIISYVTERQVENIQVGELVSIQTLGGDEMTGEVTFVSKHANEATNTYKIEMAVNNVDLKHRAGTSVRIIVKAKFDKFIKVKPSLFALDEQGNIGVKTVSNNIVKFIPLSLADSDSDGAWVSGLGESPEVIVLGQGFVRDGDKVRVEYIETSHD